MSNANTQRAPSLKYICDKRWTNNEKTDELHLLFEGPVPVEKQTVEIAIVFHSTFDCYELIFFEPLSCDVWTRFYFSQGGLHFKINQEEYDRIIEEKKEFFRKRHRHFDFETLKNGAKTELFKRVIIALVPDLLNYDLSLRLQAKGTMYVDDIFRSPSVAKAYDLQSLTCIVTKPDFLVPANVTPSESVTSYEYFLMTDRQYHLCQRGVRAFQSTLSRKCTIRKFVPQSKPQRQAVQPGIFGSNLRGSIIANIRSSIMLSPSRNSNAPALYSPTAQSEANNGEDLFCAADNRLSSPHKRSSISMAKRIGSFFNRRLSVIATGLGGIGGLATPASSALANAPTPLPEVSPARFRWIKAIDKMITRNMTTRMRQFLRREVLIEQLKRVIMRRRSDYGRLMEQKLMAEDPSEPSSSDVPVAESPTTHSYPRLRPSPSHMSHHLSRNLSSVGDHHSNNNNANTLGAALRNKPSSAAANNGNASSSGTQGRSMFRQTLSQVRTNIAAASAFARFQHLKINTKIGAEPPSKPSTHVSNASSSSASVSSTSTSSVHLTKPKSHPTPTSTSSSSIPAGMTSAMSQSSMITTTTISSSGSSSALSSARPSMHRLSNASGISTSNLGNNNNNGGVTPSSTSSSSLSSAQSRLPHDSPLMKHASRRVAAAN